MNLLLIVVVLLSQLLHCDGRGITPVRLLNGDFCNRTCGESPHTLCPPDPLPKCPYDNFALVDANLNKFRLNLTLGHNELRNRISRRFSGANMLTLEWDASLEEMSSNNARLCRPFEDDPCMHQGPELKHIKGTNYYNANIDASMYVVQNRFCMPIRSYSMYLVPLALNSWYLDNNLDRPTFNVHSYPQKYIGITENENNFTHLAFPLTSRFGCSAARYGRHFCLSCMYSPYYRGLGDAMIFDYGNPYTPSTDQHLLQDHTFGILHPATTMIVYLYVLIVVTFQVVN